MEVHYYDKAIKEFINELEEPTLSRTLRIISLMQRFGNLLGLPYSRALGSSLFELRVRGRQEIRLFYTFYQSQALLLHGFVKKTRKTPQSEIDAARKRLRVLTGV